ncbi:MAG TPA: cytochrome c3 family protein [Pyrinomonadaceae bacterium]
MKNILMTLIVLAGGVFAVLVVQNEIAGERVAAQAKPDIKMPDVVVLAKDSKLGSVTFNHVSHNGGKYSIDGTGPIACIECHHVAQPASEIAKHPPLKTAWPADRTTTLTAELFTKDPAGAGVAACRDCHARAAETPKLIPAIPEIKHEGSTAMISLTNQQAFHRNCAGCHTEAKKDKPAIKAPTTMQCTMCHKRTG